LALYEQGCYGEVVETLLERFTFQQPAHHTFPLDGKVYALLARAYANRGQLAEALAWCDKAVAADKLNHGFHYLRAMILQGQGQLEEAVRSLVRALYLNQNCVLAHFTLGHLTRQQGKRQEAMKHFAHALALLRIQCSDTLLLEAEGLTAGRLTDIIHALTDGELFR
jgi:chemotaxis protein methyltransferase CheR